MSKTGSTIGCRDLATDQDRIDCAAQKDHVWSFAVGDFERDLAQHWQCSDVKNMIIERLGPEAYETFRI
jgi:hypothetical protein